MPAHAQLQKYSNKREGLVCWLHFISLAKDTRQPLVPSKDFETVFFFVKKIFPFENSVFFG